MKCIHCNAETNRHDGVGHPHQPSPGDISLCCKCGQWMKFGPDLNTFELLTEEEMRFVNSDKTCQRLKTAWNKVRTGAVKN